jgi:hypothetical protein
VRESLNESTPVARLAAGVGLLAVLWMVSIQIVGRGPDRVWSEFVLLVGAGLLLSSVIRRDASHQISCLVAAGVVLVWLGVPGLSWANLSWASRLLLVCGVLALAAAGWTVIRGWRTQLDA